jgi:hypothetical protein
MPEDPEPVADLSGGVYPVAKAVVFFPKVLLSAVTWPSLILHDRRNNILCICTVKCVLLKPLSLFAQKNTMICKARGLIAQIATKSKATSHRRRQYKKLYMLV